ncbi:15593_t:CDS:2, partial [Acaulospora colombiana]
FPWALPQRKNLGWEQVVGKTQKTLSTRPQMEVTLEQLQSSLQDVSSGVYNGRESDLFQAIESAKPQLLNLLDSGPKSAAERSAVKDGPGIMRDGRLYKPNAAAAERIIFLSDHLNTSETYCAGLMDRVVLQQPNLTPVTHVEIATREYYSVRDTILAIWKLLINILVAASQPEQEVEVAAGSLGWHLAAKTKELIQEGHPETLLNRILSQIDEAAKRVEDVRKKLIDATSQTNTGVSLRHEVLEGEVSKVLEQRRELGDLLVLLCKTKELSADEILHLIQWTSKLKPSDDLIIHVSAASLLALSPTISPTSTALDHLGDKLLLTGLLGRFDAATQWEAKGMRAAIQLECALFLVACRARDPTLCDEVNATVDEVEYLATQAMESDAFRFLSHVILSARGRDLAVGDKGSIVAVADIPQATEGYELINSEVRSHVYSVIESTIINLLASLPNVLKKLKHKQEDVGIVARKPPLPFANTLGRIPEPPSVAPPPAQRSDIASLFRLVGVLYDALPAESALKFWTLQPSKTRQIDSVNSRLPSFVRWATESRGEVMVPAVYDMLAGLAKGTSCSEHAYNYLSTGGVSAGTLVGMQASFGGGAFSWSTLFGSLGFYSESLPNPRSIQQYRQQGPLPEIRVEEANLLVSFLKLLKVVALWSVPARLALAEHGQYRAVPAMLQLATCRIPLELKGAIYDAVAAFCSPGGGPTGSAICRNTWLMLEQLQVLDTQSVPTGVGSSHGIKFELLEVEMTNKVYPCTSSFIRLMNSLIHTPKDLSLKQTLFGSQGGQTVPDTLGAPQRTLPLIPYISFIIDDVLFLGEEHFKTEAERWSLKDMCLQFLEKSLASYELEALPATLQNVAAQGPLIIRPWLAHPGFEILNRLFSESRLRALLNDFIADGPNKLERSAIKTRYFESCMRRIIRIIHRTLDIQSYFLDMLVPTIQSFDFTSILPNFVPGQLISLDRHFLFNHVLVERVALLVTLRDQEMQLLAIRILGMLALSPHFTVMDQQASRTARKLNRLAVIIQNSDDSVRINEGFAELLANDFAESENLDEMEAHIGAGTPDRDEEEDEVPFTYLIRLEIANLLLKNTEKGRPAPNLAHLILGFDVTTASKNELTMQDPNALNSSRSCFHVITELLSEGIPFLDPSRKRREERLLKRTPLYCKAPLLAERFHRLVYQLCSHDLTSKPTARYLRTREDYFARNLSALPIRAPELPFDAEGIASYSDGMSVDSNCRSLTSFLRMRAWLLDSIALELHLLTDERQFPRAGRLLDILFS